MKIRDAAILATDRAISVAYGESIIDQDSTIIFHTPDLPTLNLGGTSEAPFRVLKNLEERFYCFAGSSNFHHLDVVKIKKLSDRLGSPLQLILVDQHMDCVRFEEKEDLLHCGNWVSYCYHKGLISKIAMIGCRDQRSIQNFDMQLENEGAARYFPNPADSYLEEFLNPTQPVYLSVDTDVLSLPSDWNCGLHSLEAIVQAPFWSFLETSNWVGAFMHGHVTDNRRFFDILRTTFSGNIPNPQRNFIKDFGVNMVHAFWPKLKASFLPSLPLEEQLKIMLTLYSCAEKTRHG